MAYAEYFNYSNCSHTTNYINTPKCIVSYSNYSVYTNYNNIFKITNAYSQACDRYDDTGWYVNAASGTFSVPAGQYNGGSPSAIYFNTRGGTVYYTNHAANYSEGSTTSPYLNYYQANSYVNSSTVCQVYTDCNQSYVNAMSHCDTYTNYSNHSNYANPSTSAPVTLSYSSPWTSSGLDNSITYLKESIPALKALRDKIFELNQKKQNSAQIDLFVDGIFSSNIDDDSLYDKFKITLDNFYRNKIDQNGSGLPDRNQGDIIRRADINLIKSKIDQAAGSTTAYSNVSSTQGYFNVNYYESH